MKKEGENRLTNRPTALHGLLVTLMIGCLPVFASSDSLTASIDNYFSVLKDDFKACAASSIVKSKHVKHINAHFIRTLKKYQPLYSLSITNSKGKVFSEIVRGEKPVPIKKDVSKKIWYLEARNLLKEYDVLVKEDNGRYYLFWSAPLFHKTPKGRIKFNGAVVAKIDLWDCFHKIAETTK